MILIQIIVSILNIMLKESQEGQIDTTKNTSNKLASPTKIGTGNKETIVESVSMLNGN